MALKMEDILKPGAELKARLLTDAEVKEVLSTVEKRQEEIRKLKQIDYEKLNNTFITI